MVSAVAKTIVEWVAVLKKCEECKKNPYLFVTQDKVPCCRHHWLKLSESNTEWGIAITLEETLQDSEIYGRCPTSSRRREEVSS